MVFIDAAVHIKLPGEAGAALAVIGGIIVVGFLLLLFFARFGKRGAIGLGVVAGLALAVFLVLVFQRHQEDSRWKAKRLAVMNDTLALLRTTLAEPQLASKPLNEACARVFVSDRYDHGFNPIVLVQSPAAPELNLFVREFGPIKTFTAKPGPLEDIGELPYGMEDGLRPQLMFVAGEGVVSASGSKFTYSTPVTIIEASTKKACTGLLALPVSGPKQVPDGAALLEGVCRANEWTCGRS